MKRISGKFAIAAAVLLILTVFTACNMDMPWDMEIQGTWIDDFGGKRVVSNTSIQVYNSADDEEPAYIYAVSTYNNNEWNGGETGAGDCGYAVVKCVQAPVWNPAQLDTFTVFRWQNLETAGGITTFQYAEGSPSTWPVGYEDNIPEAASNITDANGWFFYSNGTLQ